jgi:GT2 family glycosyltransferase
MRPVQAVVVAYHAAQQLSECLEALVGQAATTVVDNSSSRDVAAVVERYGSTYVDAQRNRGFAAGANIGLRAVQGQAPDVLLVNPDAVLGADAVTKLSRFMHDPANRRVAAVSPVLIGADDGYERVAWPYPSPWRMWAEAVGIGRLPVRSGFVMGAVLLLRHEALVDVGLFDERFFLYAEEADWQRRALARGWGAAVCPDVTAVHVGAGTSTSARRREVLFHAGQQTYITKWYGVGGWRVYRVAACVGGVLRVILLTRAKRREAGRRTRIYLRGPSRCAALEMAD